MCLRCHPDQAAIAGCSPVLTWLQGHLDPGGTARRVASLQDPAAVHGQLGAGDEAGIRTRQKRHGSGDFLRLADALEWRGFEAGLIGFGRVVFQHRRVDEAGVHRIDTDVQWRQFQRGGLGHSAYRPLGAHIGCGAREAQLTGDRTDVDDAAASGCTQWNLATGMIL